MEARRTRDEIRVSQAEWKRIKEEVFLKILESSDSIYIDFVVSLVDICLLRLFTIWGSGPIGPIFQSRFLVAHRPTWLIRRPIRLVQSHYIKRISTGVRG